MKKSIFTEQLSDELFAVCQDVWIEVRWMEANEARRKVLATAMTIIRLAMHQNRSLKSVSKRLLRMLTPDQLKLAAIVQATNKRQPLPSIDEAPQFYLAQLFGAPEHDEDGEVEAEPHEPSKDEKLRAIELIEQLDAWKSN